MSEHGFRVRFQFVSTAGWPALFALMTELGDNVCKTRGLAFSGSEASGAFELSIWNTNGTTTDQERDAIATWLGGKPEVSGVETGPLEILTS